MIKGILVEGKGDTGKTSIIRTFANKLAQDNLYEELETNSPPPLNRKDKPTDLIATFKRSIDSAIIVIHSAGDEEGCVESALEKIEEAKKYGSDIIFIGSHRTKGITKNLWNEELNREKIYFGDGNRKVIKTSKLYHNPSLDYIEGEIIRLSETLDTMYKTFGYFSK